MSWRRLLPLLALMLGCGRAAGPHIACGGGVLCDGSQKICCVSQTAATCQPQCQPTEPAFYCAAPADCPMGHCCVSDLGAHCAVACRSLETPACLLTSDCAAPFNACATKSYQSGGQTFYATHFCAIVP